MHLSPLDAKNALALIERANLTAREVDIYVDLRNKLRMIMAGPSPELSADPKQSGVEVGVAEPAADVAVDPGTDPA